MDLTIINEGNGAILKNGKVVAEFDLEFAGQGINLGIAFERKKYWKIDEKWNFVIHSDSPNCKVLRHEWFEGPRSGKKKKIESYFIITIKDIKKDEDITIDFATLPFEIRAKLENNIINESAVLLGDRLEEGRSRILVDGKEYTLIEIDSNVLILRDHEGKTIAIEDDDVVKSVSEAAVGVKSNSNMYYFKKAYPAVIPHAKIDIAKDEFITWSHKWVGKGNGHFFKDFELSGLACCIEYTKKGNIRLVKDEDSAIESYHFVANKNIKKDDKLTVSWGEYTEYFGSRYDIYEESGSIIDNNVTFKHPQVVIIENKNILDKILPKKKLYHGSPEAIDKLRPVGYDLGNSFQGPGWSLFCFDDSNTARNWAFMKLVQNYRRKVRYTENDNDDLQCLWNVEHKKPMMSDKGTKIILDVFKNSKIYVYEIDANITDIGIGNDSTHDEFTIRKQDIPFKKVHEYKIDSNLIKDVIVSMNTHDIEKYKPKNNRRGILSFFMIRDFGDNVLTIRSIKTDISTGILNPGDNLEQYLNSKELQLNKLSIQKRIKNTLNINEFVIDEHINSLTDTIKEDLQTDRVFIEETDKNIWVSTDWHLFKYDHETKKSYIREDADYIIRDHNNKVKDGDIFIYLGDMVDDEAEYNMDSFKKLLKRLKGHKVFIKGNNDILPDKFYLDCGFAAVCNSAVYNDILFTHMPVENDFIINVHGHTHGSRVYYDTKYKNHIDAYSQKEPCIQLPDIISEYKSGNYKPVDLMTNRLLISIQRAIRNTTFPERKLIKVMTTIALDIDSLNLHNHKNFTVNYNNKNETDPEYVRDVLCVGIGPRFLVFNKDGLLTDSNYDLVYKESSNLWNYLLDGRSLKDIKNHYSDSIQEIDLTTVIDTFNETTVVKEQTTKSKEDIVPVFIVLTSTGSPVGRLIQKVTKNPFNHASLAFDLDLSRMYSFGVGDDDKVGFAMESLRDTYMRKYEHVGCQVYAVFMKRWQADKMRLKLDEFITVKNKLHYHTIGLIGYLLKHPIKNNMAMFCSEFVDSMFKLVDVDLTNKDSGLVEPFDFARSTSKKIYKIFDGDMSNYNIKKVKNALNIAMKKYSVISESLVLHLEDNDFYHLIQPVIYEVKEFPVQFDKEGNLLIKNMKKLDYQHEYDKSHKLLLVYEKNNNYEGMKYELSKLWFMNSLIEKKLYNESNGEEQKKTLIKIRARILNDFNKYLQQVSHNNKQFNFTVYYDATPFGDVTTKISRDTISGVGRLIKTLLI